MIVCAREMMQSTCWNKKIQASSIIEVVIAISLIAGSVAIGTMIYVNTLQSQQTLQEIREEGEQKTELLGKLLQSLYENEEVDLEEGTEPVYLKKEMEETEVGQVILLKNTKGNEIWSLRKYDVQEVR